MPPWNFRGDPAAISIHRGVETSRRARLVPHTSRHQMIQTQIVEHHSCLASLCWFVGEWVYFASDTFGGQVCDCICVAHSATGTQGSPRGLLCNL